MKTSFFYTFSALLLLALLATGGVIGIRHGLSDYQAQLRRTDSGSVEVFVREVLGAMEETMPESIRYPLITVNGGFQRMIGRRTVSNSKDLDVVRLSNRHLARQSSWLCSSESLQSTAQRRTETVQQLQDYLKNKNIPFVFVLLPHQINPMQPELLPAGSDDCVNPLGDVFKCAALQSGIKVLDIRDSVQKAKINHDWMFFKTDHHLKPEAGLWVCFEIARHLNAALGIDIPFNTLKEENYDFTDSRTDWFLGSSGKRTGSTYAGVDSICYLVPKFETQMIYEIPKRKFQQSGDFPHAIFYKAHASRDL